jgi:FO synthase subunit 1
MRVVTISRNVFIPVIDLCSNRCGYCSFRKEPDNAKLISRSNASDLISQGVKAGCTEALFSMGESPWEVSSFNRLMAEANVAGDTRSDLIDYLVELCRLAIDSGLLPHTNAGLLSADEMKRLAPYNASMGLMLETTAVVAAHRYSPKKSPGLRLKHIDRAGSLKIPFTTGILVGIGENREDRREALRAIANLHRDYEHIQEVIIQPLNPQRGTPLASFPGPDISVMVDTVRMARRILPGSVSIQVPPNLIDPIAMVNAGANDLGGISTVTPDWINPECSWPSLEDLRLEGYSLRERLPVYPRYVLQGWYGSKTARLVKSLAGPDGFRLDEREMKKNGKEAS